LPLQTTALLLLTAAVSVPMQASILDYTFTGTGSGSSGGTNFTGSAFTFTVQANTNAIGYSIPFGPAFYNTGPLSISIAGLGTEMGGHLFPGVMISTWPSENLVWGGVNSLPAYNLASPYGPVQVSDFFRAQGASVSTTGGVLTVNSISNLTFQASLPSTPPLLTLANLSNNVDSGGSGNYCVAFRPEVPPRGQHSLSKALYFRGFDKPG